MNTEDVPIVKRRFSFAAVLVCMIIFAAVSAMSAWLPVGPGARGSYVTLAALNGSTMGRSPTSVEFLVRIVVWGGVVTLIAVGAVCFKRYAMRVKHRVDELRRLSRRAAD